MSNCAFALFMGEFLLDSHPLYSGAVRPCGGPPAPSRHHLTTSTLLHLGIACTYTTLLSTFEVPRVIAAAAYSCLSILKLAKYQIIYFEGL